VAVEEDVDDVELEFVVVAIVLDDCVLVESVRSDVEVALSGTARLAKATTKTSRAMERDT
jgi:hypothetical protein